MRISFFKSLITRNMILLVFGFSAIFSSVLGLNYYYLKSFIQQSIETRAANLCKNAIKFFDENLAMREEIAWTIADVASSRDSEEKNDAIKSFMNISTCRIFSIGCYLEGDETHPEELLLYRRSNDKIIRLPSFSDIDICFSREEIKNEIMINNGRWFSPFFGPLINQYIVGFRCPIRIKQPSGITKNIGLIQISITLDKMNEDINTTDFGREGVAFLLSDKYELISNPEIEREQQEIDSKMDFLDVIPNEVRCLDKQKIQKTTISVKKTGKKYWILFNKHQKTGWIFGIGFPEDVMFGQEDTILKTILASIIELLALALLMGFLFSKRIIIPIRETAKFAEEIGKGNFNLPCPKINDKGEIGEFIRDIDRMRNNLISYIHNLQEVTANKEKIESELNIARKIQNSILPVMIPPLPNSEKFNIAANIIPAKTVGGDLYDFALNSEDKMCISIGDVSGKGVPASLFMAITQTLNRGHIYDLDNVPKTMVTKINNSLCQNNKIMMFVTYTFAVIDTTAGKMTYCNAGHEPFYILRHNGTLDSPCVRNGIPLGVRQNYTYSESEIDVASGDIIFFYTDGVTDAMNEQGEMFGMTRLVDLLTDCARNKYTPAEIALCLEHTLSKFSGDCEQFDDITYLCVKVQ